LRRPKISLNGKYLRSIRKHLGLTQEEFAPKIGIGLSTLRLFEISNKEPSSRLQTQIKANLESHFNISVGDTAALEELPGGEPVVSRAHDLPPSKIFAEGVLVVNIGPDLLSKLEDAAAQNNVGASELVKSIINLYFDYAELTKKIGPDSLGPSRRRRDGKQAMKN
jgi:transcriptional regulator with XRE-family HTH domain